MTAEDRRGVVAALAATATDLRDRRLTADEFRAAERAVVDWFGAAIGGSRTTAARALAAGFGPLTGAARLLGGGTAPAPVAALVNGTAAHALELDDIYAPGLFHPGAPVIAAALAAAEQADATGERFLRGVVAGYEVGCRVAADLGPAHYAHWHTTGTAGTLAAAAAAGTVHGVGPKVLADALALAATSSAGLQQTFRNDAMGKPLHSGNAAQAGVVAVAAAAGGVTGAPDVLEGPAGLGVATGAPSGWERSSAGPGGRPAITEVTVKPYPCCGHAFAVIDAVLRLHEAGLRPADVQDIRVDTYRTAVEVAGIQDPRTPAERRFSIPYLAALALSTGSVTEAAIEGGPELAELSAVRSGVRTRADAGFDARFPNRRGARVAVRTRTGRVLTEEVPDRSGSPENPLPDARIDAKFLGITAAVLGDRAPVILRCLHELGSARRIRELDL